MTYISGIDNATLAINNFKNRKVKEAIRKGSRAGCKLIAEYAKATAPKRTGALAQGIKVRALPRSRKRVGTQVTLSIYYGAFVEFGTTKNKVPAQHYLEKAAEAMKGAAIQTARDVIAEVLSAN